ncbi:MAG: NAD(P)-dependent oxidoreductase [Burkholderiales bacterium]|nr:NAD(P)-dependent oxidoreductase [Burkholderiales bacterium]
MSAAARTVAFIGLGTMGRPMAANLRRAGWTLRTYDANGSGNCRSVRDAVRGARFVVTMLPDGRAVRRAIGAALPALAPGATVIDMSSSDPQDTRALARRLAARGVAMLDVPVSGARPAARAGTLTLMAGGEPRVLRRARPLLAAMGSRLFHVGPLGCGHAAKALNNYLGAAGTIAGFEALLVGKRFGVDPRAMIAAINASSGRNSTTERKIPRQVFTGRFASGFKLGLMAKDVTIAERLARLTRTATPYLAHARRLWRRAARTLGADADHTEFLHYLRRLKPRGKAAARTRSPSRA